MRDLCGILRNGDKEEKLNFCPMEFIVNRGHNFFKYLK